MPQIRITEAARFLGVSDDTVRRWIDNGALSAG
ncbi:MAG TPA: excisionase family DNA-binding protein, partial [Micrococcaceae bacterium]